MLHNRHPFIAGNCKFHGQDVVVKEEYSAHLGQAYSAAQLKRVSDIQLYIHPSMHACIHPCMHTSMHAYIYFISLPKGGFSVKQ